MKFLYKKYKKCLIVVDYQYDFVAEDGLLSAGERARNLEDRIYNLVNEYLKEDNLVIFTLDTHYKQEWAEHPESQKFNLHCEKGSKGNLPYGKLEKFMSDERVIKLEKKAYSLVFQDMEHIIQNTEEILLVGVVTDICVLQNAIVLYNLSVNNNKNVKFLVKEECCASFNENAHNYAIDYMKNILDFQII